jgi:hypothetical protein
MGGEIVIGYRGGGGASFSAYGHKRGQEGFRDEKREKRETKALYRFQAEWAMKYGAKFTAYNNDLGGGLREDRVEMMPVRKKLYQQGRKQQ